MTAVTDTALQDLNSRQQLSAYTGISVPTFARWAAEGRGPKFIKAGSRVLYRRADVLVWLDQLTEVA